MTTIATALVRFTSVLQHAHRNVSNLDVCKDNYPTSFSISLSILNLYFGSLSDVYCIIFKTYRNNTHVYQTLYNFNLYIFDLSIGVSFFSQIYNRYSMCVFCCCCTYSWNSLPDNMKSATTLMTFRRHLTTYCFNFSVFIDQLSTWEL